MMGGSYAAHREDLDVPDASFTCPDLITFTGLDELGLEVLGQRLEPDRRARGRGPVGVVEHRQRGGSGRR